MAERTVLGEAAAIRQPETGLYSDSVVVGHDGSPLIVPPGSDYLRIPGTGYLDPESGRLDGAAVASEAQLAAAREALEAARVPGLDTGYADMARTALVDMRTLILPNGAAAGAASPYWRYVWPRDTGFVAAGLCLVGDIDAAVHSLRYVAAMQEGDGTWQARYLPDGSGDVPDGRGLQLDGIGWTLWASWLVTRLGERPLPDDLRAMARRAVAAAIAAIDDSTGLPRPSQDYWETDVGEATLGSAAPLLLGLRTGRDLVADATLADQAARAADLLAATIHDRFGRHGYPRLASGVGGMDASVAFLAPPFAPHDPGVEAAWRVAVDATSVPNGGVRPGEDWRDTETAWTPQVGFHALAAASLGDTLLAHRLLSWLDVRRTRLGAIPEKVTAAGRSAAVAPIGMVAASVLLALAGLEGRPLPIPGA